MLPCAYRTTRDQHAVAALRSQHSNLLHQRANATEGDVSVDVCNHGRARLDDYSPREAQVAPCVGLGDHAALVSISTGVCAWT